MELSSPAAEPAQALAAQDDEEKGRGTGPVVVGGEALLCLVVNPTCGAWEEQPLSRVVPVQVPEALGWAVHQRVQQDERQRPGSEIHPKPHGPQAQVRGNLWCPSPQPWLSLPHWASSPH